MAKTLPNKPLPKRGPPRFDRRKMPLLDGQDNAVVDPSRKVSTPSTTVPKPNNGSK